MLSKNKISAINVFIVFAVVIGFIFYYQNLLYKSQLKDLQKKIDGLNYETWKLNKDLLKTERQLKICTNDWVDIVDDYTLTAFNFKTTGLYSPIFEEIPTNISLNGIKEIFVYKKQTAERYQLNLQESGDYITILVYKYIEDQEPIFDIYCTDAIPIPRACLARKIEFNKDEQPIVSKRRYKLYKLEAGLGFRFTIDDSPDRKRRYIMVSWSGKQSTYDPQALINLIDTIDIKKY